MLVSRANVESKQLLLSEFPKTINCCSDTQHCNVADVIFCTNLLHFSISPCIPLKASLGIDMSEALLYKRRKTRQHVKLPMKCITLGLYA